MSKVKPFLYAPAHETISYAQNREDVILAVLLNGVEKGFYVDVGANDPTTDSVTRYFYERGWTGINIEPNARHIRAFNRVRRKDVNLQLAVGARPGSLTFREYTEGYDGWSTLSEAVKREHDHQNMAYKEYEVEVKPLKDILANHAGGKSIDFLKIDVEGFESEVIAGNDWKIFRPKIVVIEVTHINKDWELVLIRAGYEKVFFDGLNNYYATDEYRPQIDFGVYPAIVTEGDPVVSWQEVKRRNHAFAQYERDLAVLHAELAESRQHETQLQDGLNQIRAELRWATAHPLHFVAAKLYRKLFPRKER